MPEKPNSDAANEAEELDPSDDQETKPSASNKDVDTDKAQSTPSGKAKAAKSDDGSESDSEKAPKESDKKAAKSKEDSETEIVEPGKISRWLTENGFEHESLGVDHMGVEILKVDREFLIPFATALYAYGFNYLQCQGGYDVGPGEDLVSFYSLIKLSDNAVHGVSPQESRPEEVRVKVFLPREDPKVPTVYWIWKTADWQERETYDMYGIVYEGHPNLKRLLMPEDWVGWPLRKDYISPDFYELQDAY